MICQKLSNCFIYVPLAFKHKVFFTIHKHFTLQMKGRCTVKKENKIFLIYKEIQSGAVAKSSMRKGFLIYKEMRKYCPIYEEAVSHI